MASPARPLGYVKLPHSRAETNVHVRSFRVTHFATCVSHQERTCTCVPDRRGRRLITARAVVRLSARSQSQGLYRVCLRCAWHARQYLTLGGMSTRTGPDPRASLRHRPRYGAHRRNFGESATRPELPVLRCPRCSSLLGGAHGTTDGNAVRRGAVGHFIHLHRSRVSANRLGAGRSAEAAINTCPTPKTYVLTTVPATFKRTSRLDSTMVHHQSGHQRFWTSSRPTTCAPRSS